jgi:hypothetical protein
MTDLGDLIPSLEREVNPPGVDRLSSLVTADLKGYLADAFSEAQLDGFLGAYALDPVTYTVTPDLPNYYQYMVVLWGGVRILRNILSNMHTQQKNQAGPVSQEFQNSATLLNAVLAEIVAKKQRLIDLSWHITNTTVVDGAWQRDYNDLYFIRADQQGPQGPNAGA